MKPTKETYIYEKRSRQEIQKRDLQKRPICTKKKLIRETYERDISNKKTREKEQQSRQEKKKRDLQKRPILTERDLYLPKETHTRDTCLWIDI